MVTSESPLSHKVIYGRWTLFNLVTEAKQNIYWI